MRHGWVSRGFALPTIVITTVILFVVLVAAMSLTASGSVSLNSQYMESLATDAAESGAIRAGDCLASANMVQGTPVTPATNCTGTTVAGQSKYVVDTSTYRSTYTVTLVQSTDKTQIVNVVGKLEQLRASNGAVFKTFTTTRKQSISYILDPNGDRASQRFWYFGNRVIFDFGAGGDALPTMKYNTSGASPAPVANEGTTVVSDAAGNLQFWSNGMSIWDKSGNLMQNAAGLKGGASSDQAVVAFPLDKARTRYGVVSNSGQHETGSGELYLSVIDMTKNGGNGAVTTKNQQLGGTGYADEALNAMPNTDGTGYYVYTFNQTQAKITYFFIGIDGSVQGPHTKTLSPAPLQCTQFASGTQGYGSINFTRDYHTMVLFAGARFCDDDSSTGTAYLFSTDPDSGSLTKLASWTTTASDAGSGYTADFSPQEKYVYVASIFPGNLTRYNIQDTSNIASTAWKIGYDTNETDPNTVYNSGGQVRRGPDGRMYIADDARNWSGVTPCRMSYIQNPDATANTASAIGLHIDGLTLPSGACSRWGLPQTATVFKPQAVIY